MRKGFTLVELAIVLVIIGLLIGGILVAQSMIGTSKIQTQVFQLQQFDIALQNFWINYKQVPGDCTNSFCAGGADNGDGDGVLENWNHSQTTDYPLFFFNGEAYDFFHDLFAKGMIGTSYIATAADYGNGGTTAKAYGGIGKTVPLNGKGNGVVQVTSSVAGIWWVLNTQVKVVNPDSNWGAMFYGLTTAAPGGSNGPFLPQEALAIDKKIDDGFPSNGIILATNGRSWVGSTTSYYPLQLESNSSLHNNCTGTTNTESYPPVANSTDRYNAGSTTVNCGIMILSTFQKY